MDLEASSTFDKALNKFLLNNDAIFPNICIK